MRVCLCLCLKRQAINTLNQKIKQASFALLFDSSSPARCCLWGETLRPYNLAASNLPNTKASSSLVVKRLTSVTSNYRGRIRSSSTTARSGRLIAKLTHCGQKSLQAKIGARQIRIHQFTVFFERQFAQAASRSVGARGVDQHLNIAECFRDCLGHGGNELTVADVARVDEHPRRTLA